MTEVVTTAEPTTTAAQVPKASAPRRRRGVILQDLKETAASIIVHTEVKPKDKGKGILIKEPKPLKRQAQIKQDEAFSRQLEAKLNANINWNDVLDEIRPLFEKHYNSIQAFLKKGEEEVTVQEKEIEEEGNKRQGESLDHEIIKKQRMDEEAKELKRHLQIVANDDVCTEATPLGSKVPVVDYQIYHENNKPYYKIIRADGTHKIMFEKLNVKANVWKDQKGIYGLVKVKSWKLFESCRVYIIILTTTQMFLLVEKKYPLTHFTLEQMLYNVRLEVEKESEMSLELLRGGAITSKSCYKCQGLGHFAADCPNHQIVTILEKDLWPVFDEYGDKVEENAFDQEEITYVDFGRH
nr:hypothetical protein [Tanacetum cinerariifolium]